MTEWCEFLDESRFIRDLKPPVKEYQFWVHRSVIEGLAQPDQLRRAEADRERVVHLHRTLKIIPPLVVIFDREGAVLQDGHHRLVMTRDRIEWLPVIFRQSDRIRVRKHAHNNLLADLLIKGLLRVQ